MSRADVIAEAQDEWSRFYDPAGFDVWIGKPPPTMAEHVDAALRRYEEGRVAAAMDYASVFEGEVRRVLHVFRGEEQAAAHDPATG